MLYMLIITGSLLSVLVGFVVYNFCIFYIFATVTYAVGYIDYLLFISYSFLSVIPELTLNALTVELERLTKPIKFGIYLKVPQSRLEIIERNDPRGKYKYAQHTMTCCMHGIIHCNSCVVKLPLAYDVMYWYINH